jgi:hypothetical protein
LKKGFSKTDLFDEKSKLKAEASSAISTLKEDWVLVESVKRCPKPTSSDYAGIRK